MQTLLEKTLTQPLSKCVHSGTTPYIGSEHCLLFDNSKKVQKTSMLAMLWSNLHVKDSNMPIPPCECNVAKYGFNCFLLHMHISYFYAKGNT